ncbi:MAG: hypothetical protein M1839_005954 [Geoglossum umbratile]|nr:MAG: hypothetical protein M1839_005954 [Geoglossum umbratile]
MPFFQITGVTHDGYSWLINQFEALRLAHSVLQPKVVTTDDETALKNALDEQLTAQQQLCIFHVNKNIVLNIKRKWHKRSGEKACTNADDKAVDEPLYPLNREQPDELQTAEIQEKPCEALAELQQLNAPARTDDSILKFNSLPQQQDVPPTKASLYALWKLMVYTTDQAVFQEAWNMLKELFDDQNSILEYLKARYLPSWEQ